MRLGTCIALELAVVAGAVGGVWIGVGQIAAHAGDYLTTREAVAAPALPPNESLELPRSQLVAHATEVVVENVFGARDAELLAPLGIAKVTKMKTNLGGTSLSLRIDFANGSRAAFKPEQRHYQSDPRREIAAYRIDRLLGIGHVPPAKEIVVSVDDLLAAGDQGFRKYYFDRFEDEATIRNGKMHGEASWWIPEIKLAALGRHRIDEKEGRDIWVTQLQIGAPMSPELQPMLAQISACIVFDLLIDNADRWSGSNTQMSPDGKTLFFMDNTMSFSKAQYGHEINVITLRRIQIYSKGLINKIRKLTLEEIEKAFEMPPDSKLAPLLKPFEVKAILARRDHMLRWIDQLIAKHGEAAVLAFP